jgi:DNA primase
MGYIEDKTVQEIHETAKVEEVVGDFVHLKKRGINYIGLCPFHNEKTPSFTVSPAKGIYKCFGCGQAGNAVNFVMEHEQFSYPEALHYLAKKYNIHIEEKEVSAEYKEQQRKADSLYIVNEFASKHFMEQLFNTDYGRNVGLSYFKERGLREETIKRFALGFANGQQSDLVQTALKKGFTQEILKQAGLATTYGKDFFRNRVQFPIQNLSGKVVGFGGRILTNEKKQPKYLNTPESDIYQKSRILYGIHQAKKSIVSEDLCYMVEGYMDVLALSQAGIENVVASSGTSLTVGQIRLVKRYTPNITILYDGDAAGIKAALRGLDLVLEQDMNVKVVLVPDGEDPDSYLQKIGLTAFKTYIKEHAEDFILFKTNMLLKDAKDDPIARAELLKDIVATIAKIPDALKRAVYVRECSNLLKVDEQILHVEINKRIASALKKARKDAQKETTTSGYGDDLPPPPEDIDGSMPVDNTQGHQAASTASGHEFLERDIARILIQFADKEFSEGESVAEFILMGMGDLIDEFDSELYAEVVEICLDRLEKDQALNSDFFIQYKDQRISKLAIDVIATPYEYSEGWEELNVFLTSQEFPEENHVKDAKSGILRFKLRKTERIMEKNQEEIKRLQKEQGSAEDLIMHLKVHNKLIEMRKELANQLNTVVLR